MGASNMRTTWRMRGVKLRRSIVTGRHGWTAVIDGILVKFQPFLGWRSRKPIEWQVLISANEGQVVLRSRLLKDAVALAVGEISKMDGGKNESSHSR